MRIDALEIDDRILDKIEGRHGVTFTEVQEACQAKERHIRRGREGLYKLFGQTAARCYLLVELASYGDGVWKVVTAREMTHGERRLYQRERGG